MLSNLGQFQVGILFFCVWQLQWEIQSCVILWYEYKGHENIPIFSYFQSKCYIVKSYTSIVLNLPKITESTCNYYKR